MTLVLRKIKTLSLPEYYYVAMFMNVLKNKLVRH